jgi:radical SAM superfamily enzyme YgiQ (UPF0313 family)
MKKKILLVSISFSSYEWLPYATGCLISYAIKEPKINDMYEFMEPEYRSKSLDIDDFHKNLKQADMLGLTNWVWNQNYNDRIAKIYKKYRPDGVIIYGGVNVPEHPKFAEEYAKDRPFVDIFFTGPAEENFKNFLLHYPKTGFKNVEGSFTHTEYHVVQNRYQYKNIEIPSPYLDGIFENIIERETGSISAIFETNRGCPYACAFCDWGGMTRSKIIKTNKQRVLDTISYIMSKEKIDKIEIGDANFGIFAEDVEYTKHMIAEKNKRKNDINLTMGGFAKNGSKYVEEIMRLMHDNFDAYHGRKYIKLSFQSHDQTTLNAVQRSNINNEKLIPMMKRFQKDGVEVDAEMIIGMPGDNQNRWLETIQRNMDLRINHQKSFTLYVVPNTPMAMPEYKEKYKIKTKKVLVPYDLDHIKSFDYHKKRLQGETVTSSCKFDDPTEYQSLEFIYECFSFNSEELIKIYDVWFWFNTLYNTKIARKWMLESKLTAKEQFNFFLDLINQGKMIFFGKLLEDFRYAVWNTIAKPEDKTKVTDLHLVNFLTKFVFRGTEVYDIYENQKIALDELKQIYPDINFDHFRERTTLRDKLRLYYVSAEII